MQFWLWFLQRLSGLLLLVLLAVHLVLTHFVAPSEAVHFATIKSRFSMPLIPLLDYTLLFLALIHGLYGVFIVVRDMLPLIPPRVLASCLVVVGVFLAILGAYTLSIFLI